MIVIGGSLGGMQALRVILRELPAGFPLPVAVVLHRHKESDDALVRLLQVEEIALPVSEVVDKELIEAGHVYIAPPDYHLLVEPESFSLSTDDPVQFARPSIDVLFESAADIFGPRAVGVVLTGANQDGARGAQAIMARGGRVIVQRPDSAESRIMPDAALRLTKTPHVYVVQEIAGLLKQFAASTFGNA